MAYDENLQTDLTAILAEFEDAGLRVGIHRDGSWNPAMPGTTLPPGDLVLFRGTGRVTGAPCLDAVLFDERGWGYLVDHVVACDKPEEFLRGNITRAGVDHDKALAALNQLSSLLHAVNLRQAADGDMELVDLAALSEPGRAVTLQR